MKMSELNLFQRINEIRKSINYVQKDKSVSTGGGSYKAVTHDAVTGMVREHMVKHGVVSYPVLVSSQSMPKEDGAKQFRYEATYDIIFANVDKPDDTITIRIQAHAMDNADKACGKALSYAKKYALLKLFEIESGDDEESRYQDKEEFNINFWTESINNCKTVDELQSTYLEAKQACIKAGDSPAMKAINALTSQVKVKLGGAS